ncbi:MAG: coenzyme F420-0:L-glutamate ligase [Candidatus Bipolaricaulaceae bacterium]
MRLSALALRFGPILPGLDLEKEIMAKLAQIEADGLLSDHDVIRVSEAAWARSQGNFLSPLEIASKLAERFWINKKRRLGVVFPLMSRNRFAPIL